jgi:hypothetical protein
MFQHEMSMWQNLTQQIHADKLGETGVIIIHPRKKDWMIKNKFLVKWISSRIDFGQLGSRNISVDPDIPTCL